MAKEKVGARGEVTPPEKAKPVAKELGGLITVKVLSVLHENPDHKPEQSENWMVKCEYPDGFIKSHQIAKSAHPNTVYIAMRNIIRGRYGNLDAGSVKSDLPDTVEGFAGKDVVFFNGG